MVSGHIKALEDSDKRQWYHTRQVCWMLLHSYADPKKAPKDIDSWWSLDAKPKTKRKPNPKKLKELADKINAKLNARLNG